MNGSPDRVDPWKLITSRTEGAPAYLSNGLIGVRVARTGGGLDYEGKPLGFFMIDEYQLDGEEKILPMPHPLLVTIAVNNELYSGTGNHDFLKSKGTPLDPRKGTDFEQVLDMKTGLLLTKWKQEGVQVECETALHPAERALGQRWRLKVAKETPFSIRTLDYGDQADPQQPLGADDANGIVITASPKRLVTLTWHVSGAREGAKAGVEGFRVQEGTALPDREMTFERVLHFGPKTKLPKLVESEATTKLLQKLTPKPFRYDELREASEKAWAKRWRTDIEIDGPIEDQQAVRSFLFYLRSSISPTAKRAISPFAVSDAMYNGHVFWDADIWVFPALMLSDPDLAKAIPDYRIDRQGVARENFRAWLNKGRPTGGDLLGAVAESKPFDGVKYPWESSVTGRETVPGPSQFEDHITGSVLWGLNQAQALGFVAPDRFREVSRRAASFYRLRSTPTDDFAVLLGTMSPDENHIGDNDLYTNLLADWSQNGGCHPAKPNYVLPQDATSFLTYDKDPVRGYKQAAAVLSIYPLQYPPAEKQAAAMMERFADKVTKNGPAMTDSVHAVIYARMGEAEKAYAVWKASWEPFADNGLRLFAEKRHKDLAYFTTGAGGSLQSVLYGFLGLRLDWRQEPGATGIAKLRAGAMLSAKPHLPIAWKSVKFKNFTVLGKRFTLTATAGSDPAKPASVTLAKGD